VTYWRDVAAGALVFMCLSVVLNVWLIWRSRVAATSGTAHEQLM
jgi:hypothetical protein